MFDNQEAVQGTGMIVNSEVNTSLVLDNEK